MSGIQPTASTCELILKGLYRRISGAIVREYAAQATAAESATRFPKRSPPSPPPEPAAISPTPTNETSAAAQNIRGGCSSPTRVAMIAAQIGTVPSIKPIVDALVSLTP